MVNHNGQVPITTIYTDGCCIKNGQNGARAGYGVFWGNNHTNNVSGKLSGPQTNQRAEATAVLVALEQTENFRGIVVIKTDSMYVEQAVNVWFDKWQRNGWRNAKGQPVANQDLLIPILQHMANRHGYVFVKHVRGHAGEYGNEEADRLANRGANMIPANGYNRGPDSFHHYNDYYDSPQGYYYD